MKALNLLLFLLLSNLFFSQSVEKIKTEGIITEITDHSGKRFRQTGIVKFNLEDGTEQIGQVDLIRIPFIGGVYSVGDAISIKYDKNNPAIVQTVLGDFLSSYGMYILIFLGVLLSLKPILNYKKSLNKK